MTGQGNAPRHDSSGRALAPFTIVSTMAEQMVDGTVRERVAHLGERVLTGESISREEGQWLFDLEESADIFDLMSWANRIREAFKGNKIHLCSILNAKAGGCSENCSFCAQSSF